MVMVVVVASGAGVVGSVIERHFPTNAVADRAVAVGAITSPGHAEALLKFSFALRAVLNLMVQYALVHVGPGDMDNAKRINLIGVSHWRGLSG